MTSNEIKIKAFNLVADLIDSALIGGWELNENESLSILLDEEIRNIEKDLRKITYLSEQREKLEKDYIKL